MMTQEQEREAFEAWFARRYGRSAQAVRAEAPGSCFVVDRALEAWEAGRASLRASPAVPVAQDERENRILRSLLREAIEYLIDAHPSGDSEFIRTCRAALSAATPPAVSAEAREATADEQDCGDEGFYCGDPECDACIPPKSDEAWMHGYYDMAAKFQQETLRTSETLSLLRRLRQDMYSALLGSMEKVDWPKIEAAFVDVDAYLSGAAMGTQPAADNKENGNV